ncbi:MAG: NAD(+)/NADH kinase [Rikenellaceae bacterium]
MKIAIFSRPKGARATSDLKLIFEQIASRGYDYCVNEEFVPSLEELLGVKISPDKIYGAEVPFAEDLSAQNEVMLCYGGDGTLLEGVHRLNGRKVIVVGVNSGRLGFLTCVSSEGIVELFEAIDSHSLRVEKRALIAARGDFSGGEWLFAANEFSVQRQGASIIVTETYLDEEMVATYRGDGAIVATPTGSTAYSLSAGGPVVAPECGCWVISPLAPHNITMRPVVVPDRCKIEMKIEMREGDAAISLDNRTFPIGNGAKVELKRYEKDFYLGLDPKISFYQTLRNKMLWGADLRD